MLTIKEIVQQLALEGIDFNGIVCKVTAVNGLKCDCEPLNGDAPFKNVRLVADESEERFVLVPAADSIVVLETISNADAYITMVSKVSEVLFKVGTVYHSINADGFLIKKGDDSLKDILKLIVEAVQPIVVLYGNNPNYTKLAQALTKIENLLR